MSRLPHLEHSDADSKQLKTIEHSAIKAICHVNSYIPYIYTIPVSSINIVEVTEEQETILAQLVYREIRKQQRNDPLIERWRRAVINKHIPSRDQCHSRDDLFMRFVWFVVIQSGIIYRQCKPVNDEESIVQLVLPHWYREHVLHGLHNAVGHQGRDRTLSLFREIYVWPGMSKDAEEWIAKCNRCLRRKSTINTKSEMVSIISTYPLELVSMDVLSLEPPSGHGNVLVITDHFTKYALAIPTKNQTAKTTAEALYNNFIVHYGIPTKLNSDQGTNFESELIKELCQLLGI